MKYDYFIASRWRNKNQVLELTEKLRAKQQTVFCFIEEKNRADHSPEKYMEDFEAIENWREDREVRDIFEKDLEGLKSSETLILLLPAGKSAHMEAGVAFGMGKKCILVGEQKEAESLYLIFDKMYDSMEEFLKTLEP